MILDRKIPDALAAEFADLRQDAVLDQILSSTKQTKPASALRRRKRRITVGAMFTTTLVIGGAAYAGGLVPTGVTSAFHAVRAPSAPHGFDVPDAHLMDEVAFPNGARLQVWRGTNTKGGRCEYDRAISAEGQQDNGGLGCFDGPDIAPADALAAFAWTWMGPAEFYRRDAIVVSAQNVPSDVISLELRLTSGLRVPLQVNAATHYALGYFLGNHVGERGVVTGTTSDGRTIPMSNPWPVDPTDPMDVVPRF